MKTIGLIGSSIALATSCFARGAVTQERAEVAGESVTSGGTSKPETDAIISIAELEELRAAKSDLALQSERVASLADAITKYFPDRIAAENESAIQLAEKLLREYAEKSVGKTASNEIVEGGSAAFKPKEGEKANPGEVYVLGVNRAKNIAAVFGNPPRLLPLDQLVPLKRGYPIADHEVTLREKTFPGATWDVRGE